jgi:hypothetical protein
MIWSVNVVGPNGSRRGGLPVLLAAGTPLRAGTSGGHVLQGEHKPVNAGSKLVSLAGLGLEQRENSESYRHLHLSCSLG